MNVIRFPILFTYILFGGLSVNVLCYLMISSKKSWVPDTKYNPSSNSNASSHVGAS